METHFSETWMQAYQTAWNAEPRVCDELAALDFSGIVAFGFIGEPAPEGMLAVEHGRAAHAGACDDRHPDWDLRATPEYWTRWMGEELEAMDVGVAVAARKLVVLRPDYVRLLENARLARAFLAALSLLSKVSL